MSSQEDEAVKGTAAGSGGSGVSTNPNESEAEHEPMAVADAEHKQDPGEQAGGGQHGG